MIFSINIVLSHQKMNNVSSHNLKRTQYAESICQFQYEIFVPFINHTIKYTPELWLIWDLTKIICNTFMDKERNYVAI